MIEIKDVSFSYSGAAKKSLNGIDLRINEGECVLLCGKSGCGKTTLTRLLNGLIPNFHEGELDGSVSVAGLSPENSHMYELSKKIGSVFQNPRTQFYTVNTTTEVAFGCENLGYKSAQLKTIVKDVMDELSLSHLLDRNIFQLSGGEKQLVAFASVYAMKPDVYVLDEPSSNLDVTAIGELGRVLKYLKGQGKTIVVAEHRIHYLKDIADRAVYLKDGVIEQEFSMEQLSLLSHTERMETGIRPVMIPEFEMPDIERTKEAVLNLSNVSISYGKEPVLSIPDYDFAVNNISAIMGGNGAGKSTLVSGLCGFAKKCKGKFSIEQEILKAKKRIEMSYIVMQEVGHQLFSDSVKSEIVLGSKNYDEKKLLDIMQRLDIHDLSERHPQTLSGGQKQRVSIAAAMFCNKDIIVFDEPTSGLDYFHMHKTAELIKQLSGRDKYIFIITHDMELVCAACSNIIHVGNKGIA